MMGSNDLTFHILFSLFVLLVLFFSIWSMSLLDISFKLMFHDVSLRSRRQERCGVIPRWMTGRRKTTGVVSEVDRLVKYQLIGFL